MRVELLTGVLDAVSTASVVAAVAMLINQPSAILFTLLSG